MSETPPLALLAPGDPFPSPRHAWPTDSPAPGLVAAGGALDVATLRAAYANSLFPWYSAGEPILWWSPDPRMVLCVQDLRLHRSLRRAVQHFAASASCEIRFDSAFGRVIAACAQAPRRGQSGTWIGPDMRAAYLDLHRAGHAHSVEAWIDGELAGGLYCVAIGHAVFGESMFTRVANASKIALAALVGWCREHGVPLIDCQQNTGHLASLGAAEMPREQFLRLLRELVARPAPPWRFEPVYWSHVFSTQSSPR